METNGETSILTDFIQILAGTNVFSQRSAINRHPIPGAAWLLASMPLKLQQEFRPPAQISIVPHFIDLTFEPSRWEQTSLQAFSPGAVTST